MREKILNYLNNAVVFYNDINLLYGAKLPKNILDGTKNTVESDIPRHVNNIITIINMVEQGQAYPAIKTIQDAVDVFSNPQIENSIQNALSDKNVVGIGGNDTNMTAKEILEYSLDAVRSCVDLLQLQIAAAKLMR